MGVAVCSAEDQKQVNLHVNLLRDTCRKLLGTVAGIVKGDRLITMGFLMSLECALRLAFGCLLIGIRNLLLPSFEVIGLADVGCSSADLAPFNVEIRAQILL